MKLIISVFSSLSQDAIRIIFGFEFSKMITAICGLSNTLQKNIKFERQQETLYQLMFFKNFFFTEKQKLSHPVKPKNSITQKDI